MNGDSFSLKARRTTRIPLRIPIVLAFREDGTEKERTIDAWTLIVNVNGARVECKHLFETGKELVLRVPHLGKSQKGSVVWRDPNANKNGGYECGIKLEKPENLWGVGFPPSDWTSKAAGIDELLPSQAKPAPAAEGANGDMPSETNSAASSGTAKANPLPETQSPPPIPAEPAVVTQEVTPQETGNTIAADPGGQVQEIQEMPAAAVDLTQDLPRPTQPDAQSRMMKLLSRDPEPEPNNAAESLPKALHPLPESLAAKTTEQEEWRIGITQEPFIEGLVTAQAPPTATPGAGFGGMNTASDRLSTLFHELVESALEQRVHGLVEGLAARMEARIGEMEAAAVGQVERRIMDMVQWQSEVLEGRASDIVSSRQAAMEVGVREYLESQEETARRTQNEMIQETSRAMCEEMSRAAAASQERLLEQAEEIVSAARSNLWRNVQEKLPVLEEEVQARGKAQVEQAAAACVDDVNRRLPERFREAEQSVTQQIERVTEERLKQFTARLEVCSEELQTESRLRIEHQIQEVWKQTSQAFLRHIIDELNQQKQAWLQGVEGDLKKLSDQNVACTRRRTGQLLRDLGTSLVERDGKEATESGRIGTEQNGRKDLQKAGQRLETNISA